MVQDQIVVRELTEMGFSELQAKHALEVTNGNKEAALNYLLSGTHDCQCHAAKIYPATDSVGAGGFAGDVEMARAIEMSMEEARNPHGTFEPLSPEERKRKDGVPAGLKNVGNTCYFNSLLQSYFTIPDFARTILNFQAGAKE